MWRWAPTGLSMCCSSTARPAHWSGWFHCRAEPGRLGPRISSICRLCNASDVSAKIAASLCAQQLNRQSIEPDFVYWVRHCLLMRTDRFPTADEVAQQLHMTSRTLRNKLRHDGSSFQSILDDVRKQIALDHLENSTMTVAEIAAILGFDSSRNFRRAFMRWTGELPSATRNRRSGSQ